MLSSSLSRNHALLLPQLTFLSLNCFVRLHLCGFRPSFLSFLLSTTSPSHDFFHFCVWFFSKPSEHHLFVPFTFHNSKFPFFPFFVYPSSYPLAHKFPRLKNAPFHRTSATPFFYIPVALSFRLSIPPTLHATGLPFSRRSFLAFFSSSAAIFLFLPDHILFCLPFSQSFRLSFTISHRPSSQLLLLPFIFSSIRIASLRSPVFSLFVLQSLHASVTPFYSLFTSPFLRHSTLFSLHHIEQ